MVYMCFVQDMRQIWTNCHLYNKKETPVDRAGRQAEQLFQEKWNRSGFAAADARARRNNAGVAAPKFEPNEYGPPEKKLQRRSSGSKNGRTTTKKARHHSTLHACPALRAFGLLISTNWPTHTKCKPWLFVHRMS